MSPFGDAVRELMEAKKVSGLKLAEAIGITPTSVSRILNGQSRPRQVTLSRILKALCQDRSEEQALLRAYSGLDTLPEEQAVNDERNAQAEEERVRRFLEVKTQSILFKRSVARELDKAGIAYVQDYCKGAVSTDFLIEWDGNRQVVPASVLTELYQRQPSSKNYGLGFSLRAGEVVGHGGATGTVVNVDLETGRILIVLTQAGASNARPFLAGATKIVYSKNVN